MTQTSAIAFRVLSPIHQANRQASLHIDALLAELGITGQEGQLLAFVAARDGTPVTAVVRLLGVSKSTMTGMLQRLERAGYLRRRANPQDGRSALLFATADGVRVGGAARVRVLQLEAQLQRRISEADLRALKRIVSVVTQVTGVNLPAEAPRRRVP
jgi:DNA-binding MarR family transcriptional regulator